ncbi:hypothetical protein ACF08M_16510 [Streptomyces sp. NPDC015032]|uniref:hypothetical protein n=1 Tax=Streptomyces sp. NPDC015032 TaxID=3364937 RepID=UPI0036FAA785
MRLLQLICSLAGTGREPAQSSPAMWRAASRAGRWVVDDGLDWDNISWWALSLLHGIDLPVDDSGAYLHDDEQLRAWLAELRNPGRCDVPIAAAPAPVTARMKAEAKDSSQARR